MTIPQTLLDIMSAHRLNLGFDDNGFLCLCVQHTGEKLVEADSIGELLHEAINLGL